EIERVIEVVSRRRKNKGVVIGEGGVGKRGMGEGVGEEIIHKEVGEMVGDKGVMRVDMGRVVGGRKYGGELEDGLKKVMEEIGEAGNMIVFIDELDRVIGAGGGEGGIDGCNIVKGSLGGGEVECIGVRRLDE
ncbi:AAA family ATPase, partial [Bacillus sp. WP8]|uniref:AAA family ATPase n=1 Tax=Bacillus sp. WP8 TaxID=756828 RepID=UPI0011A6F84D